MNAWILTWEGTSGPALVPEKKIVAIISARRKASTIAEMVDLLYCRAVDSAHDMAVSANKRRLRDNQYQHQYSKPHRLFYGRNPCIYARVVSNLTVERDEGRGVERIRWTDPPYLRVVNSGEMPVEVEPAIDREVVRLLRPLSLDVYGHEA
jgi:hypothetical protein